MKYKEIIYMILDELKISSDDSYFNEDHVKFLVTKHRNLIIKQAYLDLKKDIPQSYYQCITLDLEKTNSVDGMPCVGETYLKSKLSIPNMLPVANPIVYPVDILSGINIARIPINRLRFVGDNKWMVNIIYCAQGPDLKLYMKSNNPLFLYMEKVSMYGVFEDPELAAENSCCDCEEDTNCDIMEKDFPIEDALVPTLIANVVKELLGANYRPEDSSNNATDDLANLASFLRQNTKSSLAKLIEE